MIFLLENGLTKYISRSAEHTMSIAAALAEKLPEGSTIALSGELGAGKTVFVKGFAAALGIDEHITSPTFNIVKEYQGKKRLCHFDVYRISDVDELFEIGFDEYLGSDAICIIEWADIISDALPEDIVRVKIEGSGDMARTITIEGEGF